MSAYEGFFLENLDFEGAVDCGSGKVGSRAGSLEACESFLLICHFDPFLRIRGISALADHGES